MLPLRTVELRGKKYAFTLIELLIVVSIIGLLASLIFPAFGRAKSKSRLIQCQNNVRQTVLADTMYRDDNDRFVHSHGWWVGLANYISADRKSVSSDSTIPLSHIWHCPGDKGFWAPNISYTHVGLSYTFNGFGTGFRHGEFAPLGLLTTDAGGFLVPIRPSEVRCPSDMITFGDAYASTQNRLITRTFPPASIGVNRIATGDELWEWMRYLTHGQLNAGFGDGHTENQSHKKLLLEKSDRAWRRWNRDNEAHLDADPG